MTAGLQRRILAMKGRFDTDVQDRCIKSRALLFADSNTCEGILLNKFDDSICKRENSPNVSNAKSRVDWFGFVSKYSRIMRNPRTAITREFTSLDP